MSKRRVYLLLVGDFREDGALLRGAARRQGLDVELVVVATLGEARACLLKFSPDLIAVEEVLPDGSGVDPGY